MNDKTYDLLEVTVLALLLDLVPGGLRGVATIAAPLDLMDAVEKARAQLPKDGDRGEMFRQCARKLKLRRVDEQLSGIAKRAMAAAGDDERPTRELIDERVGLLAERKRIVIGPTGPA